MVQFKDQAHFLSIFRLTYVVSQMSSIGLGTAFLKPAFQKIIKTERG